MFKEGNAIHKEIYNDVAKTQSFREGETFGEIEARIDAEYRRRVEAYGLAEQGFYNDDAENAERSGKKLDDFFSKKLKR
jgi:hypothetical protein